MKKITRLNQEMLLRVPKGRGNPRVIASEARQSLRHCEPLTGRSNLMRLLRRVLLAMTFTRYVAIFVIPLLFPLWARAGEAEDTAANLQLLNPSFEKGPYELINSIMDRIPYYLGGLAFLAILYSGAIYIGSFGDPTKMEQAKKNLTWTVTGIVAVAAIYGIITAILWITNPQILK